MRVKNLGPEADQFDFSSNCDSGISITGSEPRNPFVDKDDTVTVNVGVTGTASSEKNSGQCTIKFTSSSPDRDLSDSCTFDVNIEVVKDLCSANERKCSPDSKQILLCDDAGEGFVDDEAVTCGGEEFCAFDIIENDYICKEKGDGFFDGGGGDDDDDDGFGGGRGVTKEECDAKANANPLLGYTFIETRTEKCGFFCRLGFGEPTTIQETQCVAKNIPIFVIVGVVLFGAIVIVIFVIARVSRGRRRRSQRSLPRGEIRRRSKVNAEFN